MPERLLFTSSIDPIDEGQVFSHPEELPRHVVIWRHFSLLDTSMNDFTQDVGRVIEGFSPLEIIGTDRDHIGEHSNAVIVRRIMAVGMGACSLVGLRWQLGEIIECHKGFIANAHEAYDGYVPYMPFVHRGALAKNQYTKLASVELIEEDVQTQELIVRNTWGLSEV